MYCDICKIEPLLIAEKARTTTFPCTCPLYFLTVTKLSLLLLLEHVCPNVFSTAVRREIQAKYHRNADSSGMGCEMWIKQWREML